MPKEKAANGITPACAGSSEALSCLYSGKSDHPRVCGEQKKWKLDLEHLSGSPPRVRGAEEMYGDELPADGITPACAGSRKRKPPMFRRQWDHPRVCGEQPEEIGGFDRWQGSPPRVRGAVNNGSGNFEAKGITPACAGSSGAQGQKFRSERDHPRVCGEQIDVVIRETNLAGSPPRVRGAACGISAKV